jgi:antitoxin ParD1/3/4
MSAKQVTRNIALTPHFDRLLQKKLASGRYQSVSEVVREGLRLLEQRDHERARAVADIREAIEVGWRQAENGELIDGEEVFREIRQLSKARRSRAKRAG